MWRKLAELMREAKRRAIEKREAKQAEEDWAYLPEWQRERSERQERRKAAFAAEGVRVSARRRELGLLDADISKRYGLALSGGGIRSATVGLGVLQALATSERPQSAAPSDQPASPGKELLREFDYVSSVSGGGYIAGFFISLFVPGRLIEGRTPRQAADDAYKVLRHEPPGRMHRFDDYRDPSDDGLGKGPLAWLRENGRYLAPTGGGDLLYAAALTIRNWFSVQYVLGTLLIAVLSLLALLRAWASVKWPAYASIEQDLLAPALCRQGWWWSPLWILPVVILLLWLAPFATGFWLTHAGQGRTDSDPPNPFCQAARYTLALGLVLAGLTWYANVNYWADWTSLPLMLLLLSTIALGGFAVHGATSCSVPSISAQRVKTTRGLAKGLQWLLLTSLIALADTLGQHLYLMATTQENLWKSLTPGVAIGVLVWLFRRLAAFFDEKESGWLKKIPVGLLAGIAGGALLLLIITLWAVLVQWLQWMGSPPAAANIPSALRMSIIGSVSLLFVVLSVLSGKFAGFLNLSTLQMLYGARLTRAYLGASNRRRFMPSKNQSNRSAAEPIPGDQIPHEKYYANDVLAPVHLINVTLNQTIDPAEQLVQRDRKGKPLAVTPNGFSIDGEAFAFVDDPNASVNDGKGSQRYTIGQWIGISGAAFTTGLGRSTSLGVSLALGLANVRLGMWWSSGYGRDTRDLGKQWFKRVFRTQTFLVYELLAMFHGMRREWQYLSDGGHYENTAVYELLRPERGVKVIVVCDNGCDPLYQFGDLANLIRLARIDYRLEILVDTKAAAHPDLKTYFGVPADFRVTEEPSDKCALLLDVYDRRPAPEGNPGAIICRIILLKPRLLPSMPVDLREYQKTHPAFPQEPTADQFFDEAQWESYRCLGYHIGRRIFGSGKDEIGPPLWKYLEAATPS
jgi:hypothetical protein